MDLHCSNPAMVDGLERRHSETSMPQSSFDMSMSPKNTTADFPHPHFALLYLDHNGKLQVEASPSIAGCGGAIFTPDVADRFMEMAAPTPQSGSQLSTTGPANPSPQTPWGVQPGPEWMPAGLTRPAELIPCEWQSQQSRWKRRDMKRTGMARPRPKSSSPPPTPPSGRTILRVGNRDLLRRYYEKAFEDFQQLNCRAIAKSYIKLVEPRKQVHYPYNGRKVISGVTQRVDPELTKPGWWPAGVLHREPDHLLKRDRLRLLVHILCELKDSHGVTADKLRDASQDVRRQITPTNRLQVLDEIYFVRQMEERFLDGEVEANTLVQVTQTHLPEAIYQEGEELSSRPHAVPTSDPDVPDPSDEHSIPTLDEVKPHSHVQGLPLSPATSESSGPHSPTTGGFGSYSLGMTPSVLPHEISSVPKSLPTDSSYMTGYFSQPFIPPDRTSGFWSSEPHGNSGSQYGY